MGTRSVYGFGLGFMLGLGTCIEGGQRQEKACISLDLFVAHEQNVALIMVFPPPPSAHSTRSLLLSPNKEDSNISQLAD